MATSDESKSEDILSPLELAILADCQITKDAKQISRMAGVNSSTVKEVIAKLLVGGYVTKDGTPTAKGLTTIGFALEQGKLKVKQRAEPKGQRVPEPSPKKEETAKQQVPEPSPKKEETESKAIEDYRVTSLDLRLLKEIRSAKKERELAEATGVDVKVIEQKLDLLLQLGYITDNTALTEKGYSMIEDTELGRVPENAPEKALGELPPRPDQLRIYSSSDTSKKIGMLLTLFGGCIFLFLGGIMLYGFTLVLQGASNCVDCPSIATELWIIAFLVITLLSSVLIIVGGFEVGSDNPDKWKQGGIMAIVAAVVSIAAALCLPLSVTTSSQLSSTYAAAAVGTALVLYVVEFFGFVFVLIGSALGITFKGAAPLTETESFKR